MSPELRNRDKQERTQQEIVDGIVALVLAEEVEVNEDPTLALLANIQREHPEIEIRDYQIDCLNALARCRADGGEKALIHMATGLGKTTVVAADTRRFLEENPGARVLFLCHQNQILQQARERFEFVLGHENYTYGDFTGVSKDMHEVTCLFASFQTMKDWREYFSPGEFDYVVVDESHHAKAETYEPTLKYFKSKFLLGLTATPDRQDLKEIREIFGQEKYSKNLAEALAEGLLARPDYRVILDDIQQDILRGVLERENVSLAEINRSVFLPKRDEEIVRIIQERTQDIPNPKIILFSPSIDHSQRIADLLPNSATFHSGMKRYERDEAIGAFRSGELSSLVTVDMFNEGMDIADANVIVFLRSTQSETIFLQQLGRGLRKLPDKDSVLVLDFVANCDRLIMIEKLLHEIVTSYRAKTKPEMVVIEEPEAEEEADFEIDLYSINFDKVIQNLKEAKELGLGDFEFTETTRKIAELIEKIQRRTDVYRNWTEEDSIKYYKNLYEKLGWLPKPSDIKVYQDEKGGPSEHLLTRGFNGQLSKLREACGVGLTNPPEGWLTVQQMQRTLGKSYSFVATKVQEHEIEGKLFKGKNSKQAVCYPPDVLDILRSIVKSNEPAPEGWITIQELVEITGRSSPTVRSALSSHGIEGSILSKGGRLARRISPADAERVISSLSVDLAPPPEEWLPLRVIANNLGRDKETIQKAMGELGISGEQFRNSINRPATYYSPEDVVKVAATIRKQSPPPAGWMTVSTMARQLGRSVSKTRSLLAEGNFESSEYHGPSGMKPYFPTEAFEYLRGIES